MDARVKQWHTAIPASALVPGLGAGALEDAAALPSDAGLEPIVSAVIIGPPLVRDDELLADTVELGKCHKYLKAVCSIY